MTDLDRKICEAFPGVVVRKDLVKEVKGNAIVPTYVLEYLLGQYCATSDEASIQTGIESVKSILREHYVHRNEAGLVRSTIKEKGHQCDAERPCRCLRSDLFQSRHQQGPCAAGDHQAAPEIACQWNLVYRFTGVYAV